MTNVHAFRRVIPFVVAIVSCATTVSGQEAALDAVRVRDAVLRLQAREKRWLDLKAARADFPIEWIAVDAGQDDGLDGGDVVGGRTIRRARIGDAWLEQVLFGQANAKIVRDDLDARLQREVDWLVPIYELTPLQKQKLLLAGRGDIKRLFDRVEVLKQKLRSQTVDEGQLQKLFDLQFIVAHDAATLRGQFNTGQFEGGSLFAKMINKSLSPEQVARYERWKRDHPVVVTRSWDLKVSR